MKFRLAAAALCLLTLAAYSNSFTAGFTLDNRGLLLQDTRIRAATGENLANVFQHTYWWPYGESGLYRPFTTLSYLFDYAILGSGEEPVGYHVVNLLLHIGNVLLLYLLALKLLRSFWPAFFTAAIWAVHPVLTESVTNMVGRADLLAAMAVLGGFSMYLKSTEAAGARRWMWLAGVAIAALIGVFSKESAAILPGVIVLYELTGPRRTRYALYGCAATLPALEAMWYARSAVFANVAPPDFPFYDNPLVTANFWTAKLTALKVIAKYIGLLLWPAKLSSDYSFAQIPLGADWLSLIVLAATVVAIALLYRWNRMAFFFTAVAALALLPSANLLFPIGTIMAERFLYLPCIALAVCLALAVYRVAPARIAHAVLGIIVAALAARTWARNLDWQNDLSLATSEAAVSPASFKSHKYLADTLFHQSAGDRAIQEAEKSLAILDPIPDDRNNADSFRRAASYYMARGDASSDRRALELLIRCRSIVDATAHRLETEWRSRGRTFPLDREGRVAELDRLISAVYVSLQDPAKALDAARTSLELDPLNPDSYGQLATALVHENRVEEAAILLMEGVLVTTSPELRQAVVQLYQQGLDTKGCAILGGSALNPKCEIVRKHLCAAAADVIRLRMKMNRPDLANDIRLSALRDFGCSTSELPQNLQ